MADKKMEVIIFLKDQFTKRIKGVGKSIGTLRSRVDKLKGAVFSLQGALVGLGAGMVAKGFLDTASAFERMEIKLDALTKGKGIETLERINKWALTMPVDTMKAVDSFVMMTAMGLDPTIAKMQILVDTAVNFSDDAMPRISRALGQMQTLGKLSAEELNQLAEAGINARKYLSEAFGGKTVEEIQKSKIAIEDIVGAIWTGLEKDFGGSAIKMQNAWAGLTTTLKSYWVEFQRYVMENDVFDHLKTGLSLFIDEIKRLKDEGKLDIWAKDTAKTMISVMKHIAQAGALVGDVFRGWGMIWQGLKMAFALFAETINIGLSNVLTVITKMFDVITDKITTIRNLSKKMEFTVIDRALTGLLNKMIDIPDKTSKKIDNLNNSIKDSVKFWHEFLGEGEKNLGVLASSEMYYTRINNLLNKITKSVKDKNKEESKPKTSTSETITVKKERKAPAIKLQQAELAELQANLALYDDMLEGWYQEGLRSFDEYWTERNQSLTLAGDAEIALLEQMVIAAEDPSKKLAAETKLHVIRQQYAQERIALLAEETLAKEELANKEQEFFDLMSDIKQRAMESGVVSLEERHIQEMVDLDRRHAKELEKIENQSSAIINEEEKRQAKLQAIRDQEVERENKLAEQKKKTWEKTIGNAGILVEGGKKIANQLYEMSGKGNKKMFALTKAFALASAIISGIKAVAAANDGTYMGYAKMAIAAALAGIQVAKIKQTEMGGSFAEGGEIPGHSPHSKSDNIRINATAGEYMQPVSAVKYYGKRVMDGIRAKAFPQELFSGFTTPSASYANGGQINFAEGGSIQALTKVAQNAPKIEIINVSDPEVIKGLAMASVHENRDVVVNMVLNEMEEKKITLQRDY